MQVYWYLFEGMEHMSILNSLEVTLLNTLGLLMPKGGEKTNNHQKYVNNFLLNPIDRDFLTAG